MKFGANQNRVALNLEENESCRPGLLAPLCKYPGVRQVFAHLFNSKSVLLFD